MPYFGTITSYSSGRGEGAILPHDGGEPLPFGKADLARESQQPCVDDIYCFETFEVNGRHKRAINLTKLAKVHILKQPVVREVG